MSLIDYSKLSKVFAPVSNYITVNFGSHRLVVRFSGIIVDIVVDVENEFLFLAGTGKRVAVSERGPLGNIPSTEYVPENSISVIGTNVFNKLELSVEINFQKVGEDSKLANTEATGNLIFGKLIHDLLWITSVQLFDISYREGNHVEEELACVRNMGGDVSSVKQRRPKAHL